MSESGFDLVIRSGQVYDGSGGPPYPADVGVRAGRIAAIGDLSAAEAGRVIGAAGRAVAPGFIDIHTHSDLTLLIDPRAESKVRQGVTLEVTGNCGSSAAPLGGYARQALGDRVIWLSDAVTIDWETMGDYLHKLEDQGISINTAALVGHGTVRMNVLGMADRAPTEAELRQMQAVLTRALDEGAIGMSTGLYYAPGSFATTDEVAALGDVLRDHDKVYTSHIRDESNYSVGVLNAIAEAIEIGRRARCRVQVSHLKLLGPPVWGRSGEALGLIESAREEGIDVWADQYPYTASGSSITGSLIPRWALEGGNARLVQRLRDPELRDRLVHEIGRNLYERRGGPDCLQIGLCPANPKYNGWTLAQAADDMGLDPVLAAMRLAERGGASLVCHVMSDEDVVRIMQTPDVMVASDGNALCPEGVLGQGRTHPRSYGTFPRVLGEYVRERRLLPLELAVRKMTALPARQLGLRDRSEIKLGYWADLVVFDPATVADRATFDEPYRFPDGIPYVVVNGEVVIDEGVHTGARPGRVLRR